MHVSQRLKMYEHVGIADNHHRRKSDERQTTNDEKSVIKDLLGTHSISTTGVLHQWTLAVNYRVLRRSLQSTVVE